ncbi:hypothetical protein HT774_004144 [Salmonella enterica]|nr:hypothetical protein [Salmonella enterica]
MITLTKGQNNHPANGPVSLDRLHQISEILSKAAAQSDGGNLGYAMADAVKVIDGAIAARNTKPEAWTDAEELRDLERDGYAAMLSLNRKDCEHADPRRQILLFTHPAPLRNAEREELQERSKFDQAKLINKFYERYPLDTFKSDSERAGALGYYMAGAELQRCGEFIVYEDANCDE